MKAFRKGVRDPWFCLPVLFCMAADAAVSLACQPAAYWANPALLREGNTAWAALMAKGPLALGGHIFRACCPNPGAH